MIQVTVPIFFYCPEAIFGYFQVILSYFDITWQKLCCINGVFDEIWGCSGLWHCPEKNKLPLPNLLSAHMILALNFQRWKKAFHSLNFSYSGRIFNHWNFTIQRSRESLKIEWKELAQCVSPAGQNTLSLSRPIGTQYSNSSNQYSARRVITQSYKCL